MDNFLEKFWMAFDTPPSFLGTNVAEFWGHFGREISVLSMSLTPWALQNPISSSVCSVSVFVLAIVPPPLTPCACCLSVFVFAIVILRGCPSPLTLLCVCCLLSFCICICRHVILRGCPSPPDTVCCLLSVCICICWHVSVVFCLFVFVFADM